MIVLVTDNIISVPQLNPIECYNRIEAQGGIFPWERESIVITKSLYIRNYRVVNDIHFFQN